jgi:uncharacterized protein
MSGHKPMINVTRGTVACDRTILADRPLRRMRGLLGRDSLGAGEGLLLQPAPSIHTAFMRFPIDVVFLDSESIVVRVVETLAPWRAASGPRARSVLELAAGEAARRGVQVGDWLIRVSEDLVWAGPDQEAPEVDDSAVGARSSGAARDEQTGVAGVTQLKAGCVMQEVVLVSRDRRFRAVMAVLLSARGFSVTPATSQPDLITAARSRAEVVVIDADGSLADAERAAAEAGLMTPDRTVVFVSDSGEPSTMAARVIPKWDSPEHLCDEIASARAETAPQSPRAVPRRHARGR